MIQHMLELVHSMESLPPEKIAFQWKDYDSGENSQKSYREFVRDIRSCVTKLKKELGDPKTRHIAILAPNQYLYAVYLFAGMLSQAVMCPLNNQKTPEELIYELSKADIELLVHDGTYFGTEEGFQSKLRCKTMKMEDISLYAADTSESEPNVDALALIVFTSGTTGQSKGVMISQKAIFNSSNNHSSGYSSGKLSNDCSEMIILPFYHVGGLQGLFFNTLLGDRMVLCNGAKNFMTTLNLFSFTRCYMVPMVMKSFCRLIKRNQTNEKLELTSIMTGASSVDPELIEFLLQHHFQVTNLYGMTETFACGTRNLCQSTSHCDSIGRLEPSMEAKIEEDELLLRGPSVMLGYYHDDELAQKAIDSEGWLHTGDLARVDEEGYYYIIGRKKNLIILSNGENVSPELLEERLYQNKEIAEVIVKEKNDLICAEIFCEENAQESIRNYIDQVNAKLPLFQQIGMIEFRKVPFARTSTGKIKRGV